MTRAQSFSLWQFHEQTKYHESVHCAVVQGRKSFIGWICIGMIWKASTRIPRDQRLACADYFGFLDPGFGTELRLSAEPISISTFTEPNRMNPDALFSSSNVLSFCLNTLFQSPHPFLKNPD
jgi:hypothetical protein